jgi:arylsulfatase A-like enzyme
MARRGWIALGTSALVCASVGSACRPRAEEPLSIRLADLYKPDLVEQRQAAVAPPPRMEWRFGDGGAHGWQAGIGVSGLAVRDGRLVGRTTTTMPLLAVEVPNLPPGDVVHELQVRMRVSAGTDMGAVLRGADPIDFPFEAELARVFPLLLTSPLLAGEDVQSYALHSSASVLTSGRRRLMLRPTDRAGADFAIESIRLVTRKEHLVGVASGLGWQGLSEAYRETLVGRAPETMRFRLRLPARPRLEVGVGTIEEWPVRFQVTAETGGGEETVLERTVTSANRWEPLTADLQRFAGREATLSLRLASDKPGAIGFWGSPVIRNVAPPAAGAPPVRGVILIWADTLRRDHLDVYGYGRPTAPTVRALAEQGVRFADCVAQASWTKVSGPSIFTALYPTTHGVTAIPDRLPATATTLTEVFRDAGWATMGIGAMVFMGKMTNLHQGFEEYQEGAALPGRDGGSATKTSRAAVDRLLPWLQAHRDTPFFVLLHVADPHSPFRPEPPYDTLWADPARRQEHEAQTKAVRPFIANANLRRFGMPTRDELVAAKIDPQAYVAYDRDWYDGSIRGMDAELSRVREALTTLGLQDRVVIAFISDHGEEFQEHGRQFHGQSVYGELTNVPLIFWGPGHVAAGKVVDGTVQLIDVMPTLIELAGLRPPPHLQGRSLAGVLRPGASAVELPPRPAIAEQAGRSGVVGAEAYASVAIFSDRWKLIQHTGRPAGAPEFELFDHRSDPLDRADVAGAHPEVVQRLAKDIAAWRALAQGARLKPDGEGAAAMSKEELERLRALGYIQ